MTENTSFPIYADYDGFFLGRRVLYTDKEYIDKDNIIPELERTLTIHNQNASEIDYLFRYYKGRQPILDRKKDVRPEICNKIVENRANQIVAFKLGYFVGEPIAYVSRGEREDIDDELAKLNDFCYLSDKESEDVDLVKWMLIGGVGYRMVLPQDTQGDENKAPFKIYTLDPRHTFVVYSSDVNHTPMFAVSRVIKEKGEQVLSIYTKDRFYVWEYGQITVDIPNPLGEIPIVEYKNNKERLGSFEIVLGLLDAINNLESNRLDGVEQFIQSLMVFTNTDLDDEMFKKLKEMGAIKLSGDNSKVEILNNELNQTQCQMLADTLYENVLTICGLPSRNGGSSSTSDTGSAVYMRNGYGEAETQAKSLEKSFKRDEKKFLSLVLNICSKLSEFNIELKDIDIRFTRRNYENIMQKTDVLVSMLNNQKIHPQLAFAYCGMFTDPDLAYKQSMEYYEEAKKLELQELDEIASQKTSDEKKSISNLKGDEKQAKVNV